MPQTPPQNERESREGIPNGSVGANEKGARSMNPIAFMTQNAS